ncbi:MAG TPA: hypothetical protein VFD63_13620 [Pyrinomonadaceae bacterium]|nr:hypothetical protein [Pyrinomonadaceae bacterium]
MARSEIMSGRPGLVQGFPVFGARSTFESLRREYYPRDFLSGIFASSLATSTA